MTAMTLAGGGAGDDHRSRLAPWRVASRVARREVRRRPGRTALVALLIAVPVTAMTITDIAFRSRQESPEVKFRREWGAADVAVALWTGGAPTTTPTKINLPEGSRSIIDRRMWLPLTPAKQAAPIRVTLVDIDATDPLATGLFEIESGRFPAGAGEVMLTAQTAAEFGVTLGEQLVLDRPAMKFEVVGIGRANGRFAEMLAPGFDWSVVKWPQREDRLLVDLPPEVDPETWANAISSSDGGRNWIRTADDYRDRNVQQQMFGGWGAGVLGLTVLGIIVAAAFAASARRQLVTLGQLAATGADRFALRRMLALQGSWSGLVGAGLGLVVGIAGTIAYVRGWLWMPKSGRPIRLVTIDFVVIVLTAVVAATVAALVPARTAAKVPVLTALGGRRPLSRVPRRLVPIGIALFGGGLLLLTAAAVGLASIGDDSNNFLFTLIGAVGGLGVLFGTCCLGPLAVAMLGPIGDRLGGTGRLATRSLARNRSRHAAVVTAIAAAGAASIGVATMVGYNAARDHVGREGSSPSERVVMLGVWEQPRISPEEEAVEQPITDFETPTFLPVPDGVRDAVSAIVPGIRWEDNLAAVFDPAPFEAGSDSPVWKDGRPTLVTRGGSIPVATEAMNLAARLSKRDQATLQSAGVLVGSQWVAQRDVRAVTLRVDVEGGVVETIAGVRRDPSALYWESVITAAKARELDLSIVSTGLIGVADRPLTVDQQRAINNLTGYNEDPYSESTVRRYVSATTAYTPSNIWTPARMAAAVVVGALLFTLLVVAIGLALSAAESRDERDVLIALGTRPSSLSRVAGSKAALVAMAGVVLAVPAGYLPVAVVVSSNGLSDFPTGPRTPSFPWLAVAAMVVAIPVLTGVVAYAGSSIARRVRPPVMSTLLRD